MNYFNRLPKIQYLYTINDEPVLITIKDIALNVRFKEQYLDKISLFDLYDIEDGETPDSIAAKFYNRPELCWIIMLFNERYDYIKDFPLSSRELERYIDEKYGPDGRGQTHILFGKEHWVDYRGFVVEPNSKYAQRVTNYEYEISLNESKRRIKLIRPELVAKITRDFIDSFADLNFSSTDIEYV